MSKSLTSLEDNLKVNAMDLVIKDLAWYQAGAVVFLLQSILKKRREDRLLFLRVLAEELTEDEMAFLGVEIPKTDKTGKIDYTTIPSLHVGMVRALRAAHDALMPSGELLVTKEFGASEAVRASKELVGQLTAVLNLTKRVRAAAEVERYKECIQEAFKEVSEKMGPKEAPAILEIFEKKLREKMNTSRRRLDDVMREAEGLNG